MSKSPFLQSVRTEIRTKQYSYRTEKSYLYWVRQFIIFYDKKHPKVMGNQTACTNSTDGERNQKAKATRPITV